MLAEFRYAVFDSVRKEIELSRESSFSPSCPDIWRRYPFNIKESKPGVPFLAVSIPVAGIEGEWLLDTGNRASLVVTSAWFETSGKNAGVGRMKAAKMRAPYDARADEQLADATECTVRRLKIGDRTLDKARVVVKDPDSEDLGGYEGVLGMQCFVDTVMVLDFEQNLLWVRD